MVERFPVVVVGAGQAGLALGYHLQQLGVGFVILEGATSVGAAWRNRWDSLRLFTPSEYDALPGLSFPKPPGTYPSKHEVAEYLEAYAQMFDLPVRLGQRVVGLERGDMGYVVRTEADTFSAEQVVVATGPFQRPFVPELADGLASEVVQLHSADYTNPDAMPSGDVLVVGAGNSGVQIAVELAESRKVWLSQGRPMPTVPLRILGRSLFWWLHVLGVTRVPADSALGKRMQGNDGVVIGAWPHELIRSGRVALLPRAVQAQGDVVRFADGRTLQVRTVIWATGYGSDYGWIRVPVLDDRGRPVHRRGVTEAPGLYFLGLRWQHTTGSALMGWVGRDAAFIAEHIRQARHGG